MTVKDVSSHDFVIAYAAHLKRIGKIEVPKWADLVKTSTHKELAPYDPDWYYIRAAAIARRVYLRGGIGVGAFKRIFGGRISRGTRPEKFATGSGSVCRHILKEVSLPKRRWIKGGLAGREVQRDCPRRACRSHIGRHAQYPRILPCNHPPLPLHPYRPLAAMHPWVSFRCAALASIFLLPIPLIN